jgi:ABC-2 type transport system ATP-binding protein
MAADPSRALDGVAGFVELPSFYPYLSGRANLELLAELDEERAAGQIGTALEKVSLLSRGEERVSGYSSGMRQRLGLAAALLRAPKLLLLDEPTAGLDPAGVRDVRSLVQDLSDAGVAVVLSSHQISELESACDTFTVLREGVVVWDGTADQLHAQAPPSAFRLTTSDDARALQLAGARDRIRVAPLPRGGLTVSAPDDLLDDYVIALAERGVAVRRLELLRSPLESMFFALTEGDGRE